MSDVETQLYPELSRSEWPPAHRSVSHMNYYKLQPCYDNEIYYEIRSPVICFDKTQLPLISACIFNFQYVTVYLCQS